MELQDRYNRAVIFASNQHGNQKIPGSDSPYILHPINVAIELFLADRHSENFNLSFAIEVALLHDVLEDTPCSYKEIESEFGLQVANGVLALTKNEKLIPKEQIPDSLERIKNQPKEIWAVKLADRISNMQKPPDYWSIEKRKDYQKIARMILRSLKGPNPFLEKRLEQKILDYNIFIET